MSEIYVSEVPVIILCGGKGTRFREQTEVRPKPMIEIGGIPMVKHIIDYYRGYGFRSFHLACGYKGEVIKHYFTDYRDYSGEVTVQFEHDGKKQFWNRDHLPFGKDMSWQVRCVDTGQETLTAGRVYRVLRDIYYGVKHVALTYGDALSDVNLYDLVKTHRENGAVGTVTAVHPPPRFGELVLQDSAVSEFSEKPVQQSWINGGFFLFDRNRLMTLLDEMNVEDDGVKWHHGLDHLSFETTVLRRLAEMRELAAHRHEGFWQCMDTARDHQVLEDIWNSTDSWKVPWAARRRER